MLQSLIQNIDERELIRQKREFRARGIKHRTNRRAERSILILQGKLIYSRNILIPAN